MESLPLQYEHIYLKQFYWLQGCQFSSSQYLFSLVGKLIEAVKTFSSSRLIMNSSWLWNLHQRHKCLRVKASRDILNFRVSEMPFPGVFNSYFSTADALLLCQTTGTTGNNAVEMSQVFHYITQFERLNMRAMWFKTGKRTLYQFYSMVLIFC